MGHKALIWSHARMLAKLKEFVGDLNKQYENINETYLNGLVDGLSHKFVPQN